MRGIAALIVVLAHIAPNGGPFVGFVFGGSAGSVAVLIFFVLSGFLMGHIYLDRQLDAPAVETYAAHRIGRVIPLYLVAVTFALIMQVAGWPVFLGVTAIASHYMLIQGEGVFWTIPVEMQFYVAFVALWWLHRWSARASLLILSAMIVAPYVLFDVEQIGQTLPIFIPYFASGLLVSLLPRFQDRYWLWSLAFVGFIALTTLFSVQTMGWQWPGYLMVVTGLLLTAVNSRVAELVFGNRPMTYLGAISFSVYLWHTPIVMVQRFYVHVEDGALFAGVAVALTVLVASVSFYVIERPGQRLVNKLLLRRPLNRPAPDQATRLRRRG